MTSLAEDFGHHCAVAGRSVGGYLLPLAVRSGPLEVSETYPFETGVTGTHLVWPDLRTA